MRMTALWLPPRRRAIVRSAARSRCQVDLGSLHGITSLYIHHQHKPPSSARQGRRLSQRGLPVIVEEGVVVAVGWEAWTAAEARGWARRAHGGCEAWVGDGAGSRSGMPGSHATRRPRRGWKPADVVTQPQTARRDRLPEPFIPLGAHPCTNSGLQFPKAGSAGVSARATRHPPIWDDAGRCCASSSSRGSRASSLSKASPRPRRHDRFWGVDHSE